MKKYNVSDINKNMGERLVMFQLMKYKNFDVDYVDYVGADLIAIDRENNKKYAISVKTKNHETDGHSCSLFKTKDAEHLRQFAESMSCGDTVIPIVAYVIVKLDNSVCTFFISLDDLDELREEGEIIKYSIKDSGYLFVYGNQSNPDNLSTDKGKEKNRELDKIIFERVLNEKRISHIVTTLNSMRLGDFESFSQTHSQLTQGMDNAQQGDFGENYITWRAKDFGLRAYLIKGEGVDVILQSIKDKEKRYAVSVKTFSKEIKDGYEFENTNVKHLEEYSAKWNMTPVVSLLFVVKTDNIKTVYNFNMKLEYIKVCALNEDIDWVNCCKGAKNTGGFRFKWDQEIIQKLKEDQNIVFTKIIIE